MTGIDVEELLKKFDTYKEGAEWISRQVEQGKLKPIQPRQTNGKIPPLALRYRKVVPKEDHSDLVRELESVIMPPLSSAWYLHNLKQYQKEREYVLKLNTWLLAHGLPDPEEGTISVNERSYEIWHQEKFLKKNGGTFLKHVRLEPESLCFYQTGEPLVSWYSASQKTPQSILIVENLDPFISLRQHLMEGNPTVLGTPIDTVLYGAGKRIIASFADLLDFGQAYLKDPANTIYYYGDLDYEGLQIFDSLQNAYPQVSFQLFEPAYLVMLAKGSDLKQLPCTSQGQKETAAAAFWNQFLCRTADTACAQDARQYLKEVLQAGRYIPQEIITRLDLKKDSRDFFERKERKQSQ